MDFFQEKTTRDDGIEFSVDIAMVGISPGVCSLTSKAVKKSFSTITMGQTVKISTSQTSTKAINFIKAIKTTSEECINFARDEIISKGLEDEIKDITGW